MRTRTTRTARRRTPGKKDEKDELCVSTVCTVVQLCMVHRCAFATYGHPHIYLMVPF